MPVAPYPARRAQLRRLGDLLHTKDGTPTNTRIAALGDYRAVEELHERCGLASRWLRYLGGPELPHKAWNAWHTTPGTVVLLTETTAGQPIALTSLHPEPRAADGPAAEVSVLIADDFQRRGLGRQLVTAAIEMAAVRGHRLVTATAAAHNTGWWHLASGLPGAEISRPDGGLRVMRLPLKTFARGRCT